jgi:predicted AAA+ superfamily ATPase
VRHSQTFHAEGPFPWVLQAQVQANLMRKMVFVGGPRQVGKTMLGQAVAGDSRAYLNYDIPAHRAAILKSELPATPTWFFDEIQKSRGWRNYLKGFYDQFGPRQRILVTGSARLAKLTAPANDCSSCLDKVGVIALH